MTGFIVALRQTLVAWGLDLFQCITRGHAFFLSLSFFLVEYTDQGSSKQVDSVFHIPIFG